MTRFDAWPWQFLPLVLSSFAFYKNPSMLDPTHRTGRQTLYTGTPMLLKMSALPQNLLARLLLHGHIEEEIVCNFRHVGRDRFRIHGQIPPRICNYHISSQPPKKPNNPLNTAPAGRSDAAPQRGLAGS